MYVCVCMHVSMCVYMYICMHVGMYTCMCVCMYVYVHRHVRVYICVYIVIVIVIVIIVVPVGSTPLPWRSHCWPGAVPRSPQSCLRCQCGGDTAGAGSISGAWRGPVVEGGRGRGGGGRGGVGG